MPATNSESPIKPGFNQGKQGTTICPDMKKPNNDGHASWVSGVSGSRAYRENPDERSVWCAASKPSAQTVEFPPTSKLPLIPMIRTHFTGVSLYQGKKHSPDIPDGRPFYKGFFKNVAIGEALR
jgi:hypothetical protein